MTAEIGHAPNRAYLSQDGHVHLNGANLLDAAEVPLPQQATFTPAAGAGGSNVCNVTIQMLDGAGNPLAAVTKLDVWLSDAATGIGLTATTPSGGIAAGAAGTVLGAQTAGKALACLSDATGKFVLAITDTAKTGFFVGCTVAGTGKAQVGPALVAANYG